MDEEAVRRDFEEWAAADNYHIRWYKNLKMYDCADTQNAWVGWLEATSRADRKAREECAEICKDVHRNYECSRIGADLCKHAIRATIKEDQQ